MEAIVSLNLIKEIAKEKYSLSISSQKAKEVLDEMEVELKSILFKDKSTSDFSNQNSQLKDIANRVVNDKIYIPAVEKYLRGRISEREIENVPYVTAALILKYLKS